MLQAAEKNGAAIRFQIRMMQPQTGAGSFATARDCENFKCVAGRKKLQNRSSKKTGCQESNSAHQLEK